MAQGIVKEYAAQRGYGVIIDLETEQELPVYANSIELKEGEALQKGQTVEFEIASSRHNRSAVRVRILKEAV